MLRLSSVHATRATAASTGPGRRTNALISLSVSLLSKLRARFRVPSTRPRTSSIVSVPVKGICTCSSSASSVMARFTVKEKEMSRCS